jgi:nitrogen fixation protein NifU and related proteins
MSELDDLYQEIILDHHRRPRNYGALPTATHRGTAVNTQCGDEIEMYIELADDRLATICFQARGCAITRATGSLLTLALTGKSLTDVRQTLGRVTAVLRTLPDNGESMADIDPVLAPLDGVRRFPGRVSCAVLPWQAISEAFSL